MWLRLHIDSNVYTLINVPTSHTTRLVQLRRGGSFVYCLHSAPLPTRQATTSGMMQHWLSTLKACLTCFSKLRYQVRWLPSKVCSQLTANLSVLLRAFRLSLCWMALHLSQSRYRFQAHPPSPESPTVEPRLTGASADRRSKPLSGGYSAIDASFVHGTLSLAKLRYQY